MKKILYVTTINLTTNTFLVPHINHLLDLGYDVEIANNLDTPVSDKLYKSVLHNQIEFSRNPIHFNNLKAYYQIKNLVKEKKYDIVHVHTPVAAFITRMAVRKEKVKLIYTAHGFHFYKGAPIINWLFYYPLEWFAARWTDIIVTINEEDYIRAKKFKMRKNGEVKLMHGVGIDPKQYELVNFDRDGYRKMLGLSKDDFVLLILAELNKNKNHIQLIKAMALLKDNKTNIKVLCAGSGPLEKKLKQKIKDLNLDSNISFIGFRTDVKELLNSCDCVGLFSKREGLGKCLLEGMSTGKPLIGTNTRGPREIISHGENGYLVELDNYRQLSGYIKELSNKKDMCLTFGNLNKEKINKYSLKEILLFIKDIYL